MLSGMNLRQMRCDDTYSPATPTAPPLAQPHAPCPLTAHARHPPAARPGTHRQRRNVVRGEHAEWVEVQACEVRRGDGGEVHGHGDGQLLQEGQGGQGGQVQLMGREPGGGGGRG